MERKGKERGEGDCRILPACCFLTQIVIGDALFDDQNNTFRISKNSPNGDHFTAIGLDNRFKHIVSAHQRSAIEYTIVQQGPKA